MTIDLANGVAKTIEFSNVFAIHTRQGGWVKSAGVATACLVDEDVGVLA